MINIFILWMITEINTQTKMIALYATRDNFCQRTEIYVCQKVYVRHIKTLRLMTVSLRPWVRTHVDDTCETWAIHPAGYLLLDTHYFLSLSRILTYCTVLSNALITLPMNISVCVLRMHVYADGTIVSLSQSQTLLNSIWSLSPYGPGEVLYGSLCVRQLIHV